ncbi:MAG TPA: SCO family protein [Bryobacteraceae bacterium]|nr:SCO family protein [Bryobacteraceae bacterium]
MRITLLVLVVAALCGCGRPLPKLGEVPHFQLTDQAGKNFDSSVLDGHVWVADFVFTNCEGPCPRMTSHMHQLQTRTDKDIRLVSFTVDPARDTPPVLAAYAKKFAYDASRWSFLTGEIATLNNLDEKAFKLGTVAEGELDHSTRFALVDQKGRIRGYYGLSDGNPVEQIAKDAERLQKESS